jgi:uracil-DNA glycosylase family 4
LTLDGAYISATVHCAPPDNKPAPEEVRNCRGYLERELDLLPHLRVVVALGKIAFDAYLSILRERGLIRSRSGFVFGHNVEHRIGPGQPVLVSCYHPSQQNTSTGRLTEEMFLDVFRRAKRIAKRS